MVRALGVLGADLDPTGSQRVRSLNSLEVEPDCLNRRARAALPVAQARRPGLGLRGRAAAVVGVLAVMAVLRAFGRAVLHPDVGEIQRLDGVLLAPQHAILTIDIGVVIVAATKAGVCAV